MSRAAAGLPPGRRLVPHHGAHRRAGGVGHRAGERPARASASRPPASCSASVFARRRPLAGAARPLRLAAPAPDGRHRRVHAPALLHRHARHERGHRHVPAVPGAGVGRAHRAARVRARAPSASSTRRSRSPWRGLAVILAPSLLGEGIRLSAGGVAAGLAAGVGYACFQLVVKDLTKRVSRGRRSSSPRHGWTRSSCCRWRSGRRSAPGYQPDDARPRRRHRSSASSARRSPTRCGPTGMGRIKVQHSSILGYLEPVSAPLYALAAARPEHLACWTIAGGALIVVAGPARRAARRARRGGAGRSSRRRDVVVRGSTSRARDAFRTRADAIAAVSDTLRGDARRGARRRPAAGRHLPCSRRSAAAAAG